MTIETKSVLFNAVPLLAIGAAYAAVTVALVPDLWRDRRRATRADLTLGALLPCLSGAALLLGTLVAVRREPLAGHVWIAFAGLFAVLLPAALFFTRPAGRGALSSGKRLHEAEARTTVLDRELGAVTRIAAALIAATTPEEIARVVLDEVTSTLDVEFGALTSVSEDLSVATGVLARWSGRDVDWYREVRLDLRNEPSGTASTAFDRAPLAIYDARASELVNPGLMDRVNPQSIAFVPLIAEGRVLAVLTAASLAARRQFTSAELELLQALANEAALALDRLRSAEALRGQLGREQLVARIVGRFRGELDVRTVLQRVVEETGTALGVSRCFVRLRGVGQPAIHAEWHAAGLAPIGDGALLLPVSNLGQRRRRTVAVADVENASELDDPSLGTIDALRRAGTRAVLATPIVVGEEVVGVFALHRPEPGTWSPTDISVAEAVARETGMALHVSELLEENDARLRQQGALLRAARQVTSELDLEVVLQRLVDELAALLEVEAADLYLLDAQRGVLTCAAVHGMPSDLVGFEFASDRGAAAAAIARGAPVISSDYEQIDEPVPHPAYAGYTDAIVAPMVWSDETRGVLGVGTRGERSFTEADSEVIGAFASLASLALRNAEIYAETSRRARVERTFYRIATVLGQSLSRTATLDTVAQVASEALGGSAAAVLLPRRDTALELAGAHDLPRPLFDTLAEGLPESASVLRLCASERRVIASESLAEDERFGDDWRALAEEAGTGALLAVPLEAPREEGSGVVLVFFPAGRTLTDDDLELARSLAGAASGALERSDLYEAERAARALAQQLARTGSLLATELDPAAVLDEVVQQAPNLLAADACAIRVLEGDELVVSAASDAVRRFVGERVQVSSLLSGDVYQSRSPIASADAGADDRLREADPVLAAGYAAYLGVPLIGPEGTVHGVLSLYARRPRTWRPDEVDALLALAANTSAALSNAELFTSVAVDRERSYAILANIADGIVAVDRDGHVVLWNAAAERITGVPAAEAMERTIPDVLGRDLEFGGQAGRVVSIARGNEEVSLSVTEAVMRDPAGVVAGRIFAFRDISADRLVEEMKSEFVATVSHELRGPLTSIYGFAETLLREDVLFGEEDRKTFLGYIASESARLTSIVDALLNVARLDTGYLQVNLQPTDVRAVVSEVIGGVEDGQLDGHDFVLDLPSEPLAAQADRDKLRQILAALIDNAVKFSPDGGTVTVAARRHADHVEVRIDDEGIGIPQSEQDWIFRKFYRGDAAATGTGLGLFIAQGLVSAMGGRISVESQEGKGSSFSFELPLASAVVEEEGPGYSRAVGPQGRAD